MLCLDLKFTLRHWFKKRTHISVMLLAV